jgi:DNA end-binding protein Ku
MGSWNGTLQIGALISPHVKLEKFVGSTKALFHEYHAKEMGEMGRKAYCKTCNAENPTDVVKGYKIDKKTVMTFTDQELETLPLATMRAIVVENFSPASEVQATLFTDTYAVEPESPADAKIVGLMTETMKAEQKVAIGKVSLARGREHLCCVYANNGHLMLSLMAWSTEARKPATIPVTAVTAGETALMTQFINALSKPFVHAAYIDQYVDALNVLIAAKKNGQVLVAQPEKASPTNMSLEEMMRLSVQAINDSKKQ